MTSIRIVSVISMKKKSEEQNMVVRLCDICGNDPGLSSTRCPYCSSPLKNEGRSFQKSAGIHKTINLERGKPTVAQALGKLENELKFVEQERVSSLTLIHGYGSSGKGGKIREECRKTLEHYKSLGQIRDYIPGEHFFSRHKNVRQLLQRCQELSANKNLNRKNKGITIVLL